LSSNSLDLITTTASSVLLSYVSIWEIAIKHSLARSDMPISAAQAIQWAADSGFNLLPINLPHLLCLERLPLHYRDPFDRMLVAQSICESLTILSADRALIPTRSLGGCPQTRFYLANIQHKLVYQVLNKEYIVKVLPM